MTSQHLPQVSILPHIFPSAPGIAATGETSVQSLVCAATVLLFFTLIVHTGDMGAVAEGAHSEVKQDVVLRLETLTVLETKVGNKSE